MGSEIHSSRMLNSNRLSFVLFCVFRGSLISATVELAGGITRSPWRRSSRCSLAVGSALNERWGLEAFAAQLFIAEEVAAVARPAGKSGYPGFGMASEWRQRTAPTDMRHHASHSGGVITLRCPLKAPPAEVSIPGIPDGELPVRSARNLVVWGFST